MFGLFKNKNKKLELSAVADGKLIAITEVSDNVFSSKTMGDGFAVQPTDGEIYAPISGVVESIFPTKHAMGLKTKQGQDVLVHMGVDTVELEGKPFEIFVEVGTEVTPETKIAKMDLEAIKEAGKATDVMVVFTNLTDVELTLNNLNQEVKAKQNIGEIDGKIRK